jgi:hypothetical protein
MATWVGFEDDDWASDRTTELRLCDGGSVESVETIEEKGNVWVDTKFVPDGEIVLKGWTVDEVDDRGSIVDGSWREVATLEVIERVWPAENDDICVDSNAWEDEVVLDTLILPDLWDDPEVVGELDSEFTTWAEVDTVVEAFCFWLDTIVE